MNGKLIYILLFLTSAFLSSVSQVLLKKAALRPHKSIIEEYTDWRVLVGYALFFGCTLLTMFAYRGIPLSLGPVLETTSYIYITVFGMFFFQEKISKLKVLALFLIIGGVLLYTV